MSVAGNGFKRRAGERLGDSASRAPAVPGMGECDREVERDVFGERAFLLMLVRRERSPECRVPSEVADLLTSVISVERCGGAARRYSEFSKPVRPAWEGVKPIAARKRESQRSSPEIHFKRVARTMSSLIRVKGGSSWPRHPRIWRQARISLPALSRS